jgi:hypothetical protein
MLPKKPVRLATNKHESTGIFGKRGTTNYTDKKTQA